MSKKPKTLLIKPIMKRKGLVSSLNIKKKHENQGFEDDILKGLIQIERNIKKALIDLDLEIPPLLCCEDRNERVLKNLPEITEISLLEEFTDENLLECMKKITFISKTMKEKAIKQGLFL